MSGIWPLIAILIVLIAILINLRFGFNQVIKGLEAISDRLDLPRDTSGNVKPPA